MKSATAINMPMFMVGDRWSTFFLIICWNFATHFYFPTFFKDSFIIYYITVNKLLPKSFNNNINFLSTNMLYTRYIQVYVGCSTLFELLKVLSMVQIWNKYSAGNTSKMGILNFLNTKSLIIKMEGSNLVLQSFNAPLHYMIPVFSFYFLFLCVRQEK